MTYSVKEVTEKTILLGLTGSRSYGLHTPSSDYDYRGILVQDLREYVGFSSFEQKDKGFDTEISLFPFLSKDTVIYDVKKYLKLAQKSNPNILELLYLPEYLHLTEAAKVLIKYRECFISRQVKSSYLGYAYGQIKRVENHRKWLLNPPSSPPELPEQNQVLSKAELQAFLEFLYNTVKNKIEYLEPSEVFREFLNNSFDFKGIFKNYPLEEECLEEVAKITQVPTSFISKVQENQRYQTELKKYSNYLSWIKNRNPDRAKFEALVGYDVKHASHCLRILYQLESILEKGDVIVEVKNFPYKRGLFLRSILEGKVSYEKIKEESENLFQKLKLTNFDSIGHPLSNSKLTDIVLEVLETHTHV